MIAEESSVCVSVSRSGVSRRVPVLSFPLLASDAFAVPKLVGGTPTVDSCTVYSYLLCQRYMR